LDNTDVTGMLDIVQIGAGGVYDFDIIAEDCSFPDAASILNCSQAGSTIHYTSLNCTYAEPTAYLWHGTNVGVTIDVQNSIGAINQAKIVDANIVVTACDLIIPAFVSADAGDNADNRLVIDFNDVLDATSVPAVTAFTVSGKTVSNVAISGSQVILTVSANFINTDVITVAYTQPTTNKLRGHLLGLVASFGAQSVLNVLDNLITNGDFRAGTGSWRTDYGGLTVASGVATIDDLGTSLAIISNSSYNPIATSYEIYVKVSENISNKDLDIGLADDDLANGVHLNITNCPLGINHITLTALLQDTLIYIYPKLVNQIMKIDFVVIRLT
jgi:hypothetical protein